MFTEQEKHDIRTAGDTLCLVNQILTYTRPENWAFGRQFPEHFRAFRMSAGRLARVKDRKLREYGKALLKFDVCLTELDRGFSRSKAAEAREMGQRVVDAMEGAKAYVV